MIKNNPAVTVIRGPRLSGKTTMVLHGAVAIANANLREYIAFVTADSSAYLATRKRISRIPRNLIFRSLKLGTYSYKEALDRELISLSPFLVVLDDASLMIRENANTNVQEFAEYVAKEFKTNVWAVDIS